MIKLLTDLNPKWTGLERRDSGEGLRFDCPTCGPSHTLVAYFSNPLDRGPTLPGNAWTREGEAFDELTIRPSIQYPCFHGWVEKGLVIDVAESPITIVARVHGELRPVTLSPLQALDVATKIRATVDRIRGRRAF